MTLNFKTDQELQERFKELKAEKQAIIRTVEELAENIEPQQKEMLRVEYLKVIDEIDEIFAKLFCYYGK